jgi:hypothetical protein
MSSSHPTTLSSDFRLFMFLFKLFGISPLKTSKIFALLFRLFFIGNCLNAIVFARVFRGFQQHDKKDDNIVIILARFNDLVYDICALAMFLCFLWEKHGIADVIRDFANFDRKFQLIFMRGVAKKNLQIETFCLMTLNLSINWSLLFHGFFLFKRYDFHPVLLNIRYTLYTFVFHFVIFLVSNVLLRLNELRAMREEQRNLEHVHQLFRQLVGIFEKIKRSYWKIVLIIFCELLGIIFGLF